MAALNEREFTYTTVEGVVVDWTVCNTSNARLVNGKIQLILPNVNIAVGMLKVRPVGSTDPASVISNHAPFTAKTLTPNQYQGTNDEGEWGIWDLPESAEAVVLSMVDNLTNDFYFQPLSATKNDHEFTYTGADNEGNFVLVNWTKLTEANSSLENINGESFVRINVGDVNIPVGELQYRLVGGGEAYFNRDAFTIIAVSNANVTEFTPIAANQFAPPNHPAAATLMEALEYLYTKAGSGAEPINTPPVASAGADNVITLPTNTVVLQGSATDTDGTIVSYLWEQVIGPAVNISNPNIAQPTAGIFNTPGTYEFRLTVADDKGAIHTDSNVITVNQPISQGTAKVMVMSGQSNILGYAYRTDLDDPSYSYLDLKREFQRVKIWNPTTNAYEKLKLGVNSLNNELEELNGRPLGFGPELAIAARWELENSTETLYIVKHGWGATTLQDWAKGGKYYNELKSRSDKSRIWLTNNGFIDERVGVDWMQGESSSAGETTASYQAALTQLMADFEADGIISAASRRVISEARNRPEISLAQEAYVNSDPTRARFIDTTFYSVIANDVLHYNAKSVIRSGGTDVYNAIFGTTGRLVELNYLLKAKSYVGANTSETWVNLANSAKNVYQPDATKRYTLEPNVLNGKAGYYSDGTNQKHFIVPPLRSDAGEYTVQFAVRPTVANNGITLMDIQSGRTVMGVGTNNDVFTATVRYNNAPKLSQALHVVTYKLQSGTNKAEMWIDKTIVWTGTITPLAMQGLINIGKFYDNGQVTPIVGYIFGAFVIDEILSTNDINANIDAFYADLIPNGEVEVSLPATPVSAYKMYAKSYEGANTPETWVNLANSAVNITQNDPAKQFTLQTNVLNEKAAYFTSGTNGNFFNVPALSSTSTSYTVQFAYKPSGSRGVTFMDIQYGRTLFGIGTSYDLMVGGTTKKAGLPVLSTNLNVITYRLNATTGVATIMVNKDVVFTGTTGGTAMNGSIVIGKQYDGPGAQMMGYLFGVLIIAANLTDAEVYKNINMFRTDLGLEAI